MDNNVKEIEPIVTSPLPTKTIANHTLTFPQAIQAVIDGRKITKLEWNDNGIYGFLATDGHLKINLPNKLSDWILSDGDLNGTDYIVLEEAN